MLLINLRGTPRDSRKKPKAGSYSKGSFSTVIPCRGLEKNSMVGNGMGAAWQV